MKMSCPKTGESSRYSSDRAATNESAPCTRTRGRQHILRRKGATRMYHLAAEADQTNLTKSKAEQNRKSNKAQAEQDKQAEKTTEQTEQRKMEKKSKAREKSEHSTAEQTQQTKEEQSRTDQSR